MEIAKSSNNYHYNPQLKCYANDLRKNMTKAEASLWKHVLKARQMKGYLFRRQRPVLCYIADFMSKELMLIIEEDGRSHDLESVSLKDLEKTKALKSVGFTMMRYTDEMVLQDIEGVKRTLEQWIEAKENHEI